VVACNRSSKTLNRRVTLWRKDKIPYGTYYAYENMKNIFPDADIQINKSSPLTFPAGDYSQTTETNKRRTAYIVISPQVLPDAAEINALINFVGNGNQVFISSFYFGDSLLSYLKLQVNRNFLSYSRDSLQLSVYNPITYDSMSFLYPGFAGDNYVTSMDTQYTTILGRDVDGNPDFVKFTYKGGGALYLHFAPIALTNFFLLHKNNKAYFENVFSYIPSTVNEVRWDDYFRYAGKRGGFSTLQYIFGNRSLRWAFWLILLLFAIIYLFESKRRQKLIPMVSPLNNSSLDFVKTIGRLYYQQKDNNNLTSKMATHFLDHVRTRYNLSTSVLDEDFVERLAYKSGFDKNELKRLIYDIKTFQDTPSPSDKSLMELNERMEAFYKQP